ncbi:putative late blight resistance protein homolog R1A-10 [Salvia splendens]|uniref:putative late blight resistance protein homolog R1A-10 n=1 Tax=Salvia splendens TaxID=180675 RepID=UPI001C259B03|nr:putative late blight resistance protein homolog R1A-10 [Salvia splendens]
MAYEAVDSLQQTLLLILQRHDDLITPPVKQQIISIHDKAAGLQLNLKHFPDKETIREVANTAKRIIEYLFSPLNLSDFGFIHPTVRLPNQLGELARELDSTVGYVVDYCKINSNSVSDSPGVSSSSRSALKSQVDHLTIAKELIVRDSNKSRLLGGRIKSAPSPVITRFSLKSPVELIAINTYRLKRLEEKIKSTAKELADDTIGPSYSIPISLPTNKDVFAGFDDDLNDSAAVASSSRPAPKRAEDPSDTPSIYPSTTKYDVVGFDEDVLHMVHRLTGYSSNRRQILPIVGMGGIGKSTLAKYVYHHPMIMDQYDIRAWITISQDYSIPSILSQLLASLKGKVERVERDSLKVIEAEKLEIKKILSGKRYLIVIDDIWSVVAWNRIRCLFPNNDNRSRIILTTRLMDVATNAAISRNIHMMRFLDDVQSWRLFHDKVFGDQDCPIELQSVGEKIVKGCGGLPLSIVTVAGLLSRIPRTPKLWKQIEVNDGQLGSILSLSYNHLPLHLRKCFLYMAAFPQEYDIRASELIKLWVAEVWQYAFETVDLFAEQCLEDLIKQSLVLISSRKTDGKIKSCRLHSMVRDFCVRQAGQEKFLSLLWTTSLLLS